MRPATTVVAPAGAPWRRPGRRAAQTTTLSIWPVRFLMWTLPYHAEHHLYPSIPFHHLPATHRRLRSHLRVLARGYVGVQRSLYTALPRPER